MSFRLFASSALLLIAATSLTASEVRVWGSTNTADASAAVWASIYAVPAGLTDVTQVAVTGSTIAALRANGSVVVWGVAGDPTLTVPVAAQSGVTQIAATSDGAVYARRSDGTMVAWGDPVAQQLAVPSGMTGVAAVRGGGTQGLAIKTDGSVVGWGANYVAPSVGFTCADAYPNGVARLSDSSLVHWDQTNVYASATSLNIPAGLTGAALFGDGFRLAGVVNSSGQVTVWGRATAGQANVPAGLTGIAELAFGDDHVVARSTTGNLTIWGDGLTTRPEIAVPSSVTGCLTIAAGYRFTVAVLGVAPTDITLNPATVVAGAVANSAVGTLAAVDSDPTDTHTFQLVPGLGADDNALFAIQNSTLGIGSVNLASTGATTLHLRVRASDREGFTIEKALAVVVTAAPQTDDNQKSGLFGGCGIGSGVSIVLGSLAFALRFLWKRHS